LDGKKEKEGFGWQFYIKDGLPFIKEGSEPTFLRADNILLDKDIEIEWKYEYATKEVSVGGCKGRVIKPEESIYVCASDCMTLSQDPEAAKAEEFIFTDPPIKGFVSETIVEYVQSGNEMEKITWEVRDGMRTMKKVERMKDNLNVLFIGKADARLGDFKERMEEYSKQFNSFHHRPEDMNGIWETIRKNRIDCIVAQDPCVCGLAATIISKRIKAPLIIQLHGFEYIKGWRKDLSKVIFRQCQAIQVVSKSLRRALMKLGWMRNVIYVQSIPINMDKMKASKKERKSLCDTFVFVGRLIPVKSVDTFLEAAKKTLAKHPNTKFKIVGQGQEEARLKKLAEDLGIAHAVEFLGFLNHKDALKVMRHSTSLVLPSYQEGFGLVLAEGAAQGIPVIASDKVGCVDEVVIDNITGLVFKSMDSKGLSQCMNHIIENPKEAKRLGDNGKKLMRERFDVKVVVPKIRKMYEEVIAEYKRNKK
jgi:glycosyltransferase involved in cell wall biosynthesis